MRLSMFFTAWLNFNHREQANHLLLPVNRLLLVLINDNLRFLDNIEVVTMSTYNYDKKNDHVEVILT